MNKKGIEKPRHSLFMRNQSGEEKVMLEEKGETA
jgi:hypothetical protein